MKLEDFICSLLGYQILKTPNTLMKLVELLKTKVSWDNCDFMNGYLLLTKFGKGTLY